jgi:3-phenylpropionate/cinnamic acid dioxygenase small subunit
MSVLNERASSGFLVGVGPELTHEISQFLYYEARLLDDRKLAEWMDLLADDLHYWMPLRNPTTLGEHSTEDQLAHFDHDKQLIHRHVKSLLSGRALSEIPPSRTRHLISNVEVRESRTAGELDVRSAFLVYRGRREREVEIISGARQDRIRTCTEGLGWQIASRKVVLDQSTILGRDLSMFF